MKKNILILFIGILLLFSCVNQANNALERNTCQVSDASKTKDCVPEQSIFLLKNIKEIDRKDNSTVKKLGTLNEKQIEAWIKPIPDVASYAIDSEYGLYYKAVSILNITDEYYLLLLMQCEKNENEVENGDIEHQQFIVSVDKKGKYIDALAVSYIKDLVNWEGEFDAKRNIYRYSTNAKSFFSNDNIKVIHECFVSDIRETSKIEYWEEWDEIIYSVKEDGRIVVTEPRKKIAEKRN